MKRLDEGMRAGDLEDLVLPLISVDEYQSKIGDDAIVFAFYVSEKGAADDLNRFIQRSPHDLLDTDISPAPDQHGYYLVFVELLNNNQTAENFDGILEEVAALANIESWSMHSRNGEHLLPYAKNTLADMLKKEPERSSSEQDLHEAVLTYLTPSLLANAWFSGHTLSLDGQRDRIEFDFVRYGQVSDILTESNLLREPITLDLGTASFCNRVRNILGENWTVTRLGENYIVQRIDCTDALHLKRA